MPKSNVHLAPSFYKISIKVNSNKNINYIFKKKNHFPPGNSFPGRLRATVLRPVRRPSIQLRAGRRVGAGLAHFHPAAQTHRGRTGEAGALRLWKVCKLIWWANGGGKFLNNSFITKCLKLMRFLNNNLIHLSISQPWPGSQRFVAEEAWIRVQRQLSMEFADQQQQ
jgi:hypothetical protein